MKTFLSLAMLAMFSAAMVGCHASGEVGDNDGTDNGSSYKKTTTVHNDGDSKTVKTEKKTTTY